MELSRIAPELRGLVRWSPPLPIKPGLGLRLTRALVSLMPKVKLPDVDIQHTEAKGAAARLYLPSNRLNDACLLWIHGGGYVVGSAIMDDRPCSETARDLGIVVVSVDYRLAPEHPFPAAIDDCFAVWTWLQDAAAGLGVNPERIVVGGQSAGAGLAASLIHRIHDGGGQTALAQWLFCPMLDDRTAGRRDLDAIRHRLWDNRSNAIGWQAYLAQEPGEADTPNYAVPARRQDLRGLPKTWIGVGDIDLFYDEDLAYAARLRSAGVDVAFETVSGAPHGFESRAPHSVIAKTYIAAARSWLRQIVHQGGGAEHASSRAEPFEQRKP